jgi:heat shock protein HslJ
MLSTFSIAYSIGMRVFATFLVLVLASCAPKNTSKAPSGALFSSIKWTDLTGAPFILTSLTLKMKEIQLPATRKATMQFFDTNRVGGNAGVNRYTVEATVSGKDSIAWTSSPITTRMAGPPEAMSMESDFLQALEAVTRIELEGGTLKLASADGSVRLALTR